MHHEENDTDVLRRIKNGEIDRYSVIVKKYTSRIHQYVSSKLFDRAEADDIVQKTFVQFYRAVDRFDDRRVVLPYLYEIAKNELKMFFRSHRETVSLDDRIGTGVQTENISDAELEDLLRTVSPEQRRALRMLYEGYSYREIAAVLKRPMNTVRTLIRRARQLLVQQNNEKPGR